MTLFLIADERNPHSRTTVMSVARRFQREAPLTLIARYQPGVKADADAGLIVSDLPRDVSDVSAVWENIRRLHQESSTELWVPGIILASFDPELVADKRTVGLQKTIEGQLVTSIWTLALDQTSLRRPLPDELHSLLKKLDTVRDVRELLALPTYVEAAGGYVTARNFLQAATERFGGDGHAVVDEVAHTLTQVLSVWGYEAAISWMRSSNAFLDGARPIQALALYGPERVINALDAEAQFVYS